MHFRNLHSELQEMQSARCVVLSHQVLPEPFWAAQVQHCQLYLQLFSQPLTSDKWFLKQAVWVRYDDQVLSRGKVHLCGSKYWGHGQCTCLCHLRPWPRDKTFTEEDKRIAPLSSSPASLLFHRTGSITAWYLKENELKMLEYVGREA